MSYAHRIPRNYYSDTYKRRTCVYRLYDADEVLLYVGLSLNPPARLSAHRRREWGGAIERVAIEWFVNREAAKAAERRAIATENPIHNIVRPKVDA